MKSQISERGFSLIEAVVSMAVLSVGIVAIFTVFNAVMMLQQSSEAMLEQGLEINSVVEELRVLMPEKTEASDLQSQASMILSKHKGWAVEEVLVEEFSRLYTFKLSFKQESGKKSFFYAKIYYP